MGKVKRRKGHGGTDITSLEAWAKEIYRILLHTTAINLLETHEIGEAHAQKMIVDLKVRDFIQFDEARLQREYREVRLKPSLPGKDETDRYYLVTPESVDDEEPKGIAFILHQGGYWTASFFDFTLSGNEFTGAGQIGDEDEGDLEEYIGGAGDEVEEKTDVGIIRPASYREPKPDENCGHCVFKHTVPNPPRSKGLDRHFCLFNLSPKQREELKKTKGEKKQWEKTEVKLRGMCDNFR